MIHSVAEESRYLQMTYSKWGMKLPVVLFG